MNEIETQARAIAARKGYAFLWAKVEGVRCLMLIDPLTQSGHPFDDWDAALHYLNRAAPLGDPAERITRSLATLEAEQRRRLTG